MRYISVLKCVCANPIRLTAEPKVPIFLPGHHKTPELVGLRRSDKNLVYKSLLKNQRKRKF